MSFLFGVASLFRALGFLARTPGTWGYAMVPSLVLLLLLTGLGWLSLEGIYPWVFAHLPEVTSAWARALSVGVTSLLTLAAFALGAFFALTLAAPLSGPALERIVGMQETALGVPVHQPIGFWSEIVCGIKAQLLILLVTAPLVIALWFLELLVPLLAPITIPFKLLLGSFALAWNLFDYPLSLRGIPMRTRWQLLQRHWAPGLGFGATFAVVFWIPCGCQIVLLPVGVAAATQLAWEWAKSDPQTARALTGTV